MTGRHRTGDGGDDSGTRPRAQAAFWTGHNSDGGDDSGVRPGAQAALWTGHHSDGGDDCGARPGAQAALWTRRYGRRTVRRVIRGRGREIKNGERGKGYGG